MKRIKTRMTIGIFSIFLVSFIVLMVNIGANQRIANNSQSLLKDNFPSVKYSFEMFKILNEINNDIIAPLSEMIGYESEDSVQVSTKLYLTDFEQNLNLQKNNITETGEQELTESLQKAFDRYKLSVLNTEYSNNYSAYYEKYRNLREYILSIHDLNVSELEQKNEDIKCSALRVLNIQEKLGIVALTLLSILIFLVPFLLLTPINKLSDRMITFYKTNFNKDIDIKSNHELEKLEEIFEKIVLETSKPDQKE